MPPRKFHGVLPLGLSLLLLANAGCTPTDTAAGEEDHHDDHHRPESLHVAVAELKHVRDEVKTAMESGSPDAAHEPLHEVGELLEMLPEVAADTDLPREKWEIAKAETNKLFDAFGVIDEAFHTAGGDKQAAYSEVAASIDESIAALEALLPLAGEKPPHEGAHEGDEHEEGSDHDHDHADESSKE